MQCTICGKFAIFHIPRRFRPGTHLKGDKSYDHFCSIACWQASKNLLVSLEV